MTATTIVLGLLALSALTVTAVCAATVLLPSRPRHRDLSSSTAPPESLPAISVLKPLTGIAPTAYLAEALLNPVPWIVAWAVACSLDGGPRTALAGAATGVAAKAALDALLLHHLRGTFPALGPLAIGPIKDVAIFGVWVAGVFRRTIVWRGTRLRIARGSLLQSLDDVANRRAPADPGESLTEPGRAA